LRGGHRILTRDSARETSRTIDKSEKEHGVCLLSQKFFTSLFVLIFLLGSAEQICAQGGATGAITVTVQDPSGGAIASAKVEIVSEATGQVVRDLITDSSGSFTATLLRWVLLRRSERSRLCHDEVYGRPGARDGNHPDDGRAKVTQATETVTCFCGSCHDQYGECGNGEALDSTTFPPAFPTRSLGSLFSAAVIRVVSVTRTRTPVNFVRGKAAALTPTE